jgi:hypothetical protein
MHTNNEGTGSNSTLYSCAFDGRDFTAIRFKFRLSGWLNYEQTHISFVHFVPFCGPKSLCLLWLNPLDCSIAELFHRCLRVGSIENRRAGHDDLRPGSHHSLDIFAVDAAVNFDPDV